MEYFTLPDVLTKWPWPSQLNPHYREVGAESSAWANTFQLLSADKKKAFDKGNFNLLAALANPTANERELQSRPNATMCPLGHHLEQLRSCCDLMHIFFVFDDLSDSGSSSTVRQQADMIMDALRNPDSPRPEGELPLGEMTRQFWSRTLCFAKPSPITQRRFIEAFDTFTTAVSVEAEDRDQHLIRDIKSYMALRSGTIGMRPSFVLLELGMNLPEIVLDHPVIKDMECCVIGIIITCNDMYSYNVEQARGDDHNLVTVVMKDLGTDLQGALWWIQKYCAMLEARFLKDIAHLPQWGEEINGQVVAYVNGLGNWARANETWSFETERYFGRDGLNVQRHRKVMLAPKKL